MEKIKNKTVNNNVELYCRVCVSEEAVPGKRAQTADKTKSLDPMLI